MANSLLLYVFMQKMPGNTRDVNSYTQFLKDTVIPRLEALPGVGSAQINSNGGTDEIDIVFDPMRAAQLGVQIPKMAQQISGAEDVSGGTIDVGRRQYGLEFRGRYSVAALKNLVLEWRDGKPVHLGDPMSMSGAARRMASPIRTATRRWACRCSAPTAPMCWPPSTR